MELWPKNWSEFQHYKNRSPAWIKLHANILDDYDFCVMHVASRALAPMLWLLASKYENGKINESPTKLAFKLRMTVDEFIFAVKPLIDNKFFNADSEMLAECLQDACLEERERRGETEREEEASREGEKTEKPKKASPEAPKFLAKQALMDLGVTEQVAADFIAMRKAKLTETAITGIKREADKAGFTLEDALKECVARGWQGFKADWVNKGNPSTGKAGMSPETKEFFNTNYDRTEAVRKQKEHAKARGIDYDNIKDEDLIF